MFIATTFLAIESIGRTPEGSRRGHPPRRRTAGRQTTKMRVTQKQLDEMAKALAKRLNHLVDGLPDRE
jgi:hypothetical protein